jgi:hypothetical protein
MSETTRLRVEAVEERPRPKAVEAPPPPAEVAAPEPAPVETEYSTMLASFRTLGYVLSGRFILLLALIGAFILTCMAMFDPSVTRLWIAGTFAALALWPCVFLEVIKRR